MSISLDIYDKIVVRQNFDVAIYDKTHFRQNCRTSKSMTKFVHFECSDRTGDRLDRIPCQHHGGTEDHRNEASVPTSTNVAVMYLTCSGAVVMIWGDEREIKQFRYSQPWTRISKRRRMSSSGFLSMHPRTCSVAFMCHERHKVDLSLAMKREAWLWTEAISVSILIMNWVVRLAAIPCYTGNRRDAHLLFHSLQQINGPNLSICPALDFIIVSVESLGWDFLEGAWIERRLWNFAEIDSTNSATTNILRAVLSWFKS